MCIRDRSCLAEVGLRPTTLFDTELAGRLLGYPRVGLATLVETVVGRSLRKEHSAVDWSTRPLPEPWREIAARRDVTPGRIIPDSAIVEAANAMPRDKPSLLAVKGFRGRGAERYAHQWVEALRVARALPEEELPPVAARYDGPPPPRAWADRDPIAAARLTKARIGLKALSDKHGVPLENLLTPDFVRRVMWEPPVNGTAGDATGADRDQVTASVADRLADLGARAWQVELTTGLLTDAILDPAVPVAPEPADAIESAPDLAT